MQQKTSIIIPSILLNEFDKLSVSITILFINSPDDFSSNAYAGKLSIFLYTIIDNFLDKLDSILLVIKTPKFLNIFSSIPLARKYPPKYNNALFIFTATIVSIIFPCKYPKGIDKRELIKINIKN